MLLTAAAKLEGREYDTSKKVPPEVKLKVLEACRLTASGTNNTGVSSQFRTTIMSDS
jgi:hypothetical protein